VQNRTYDKRKAKTMKKPNGYVIYRGPSLIDGAPIVVIASGINKRSKNEKTGGMLQTYILRSDMHPFDANKTGADVSICGTCPHRGTPTADAARKLAEGRSCYVNMGQGVLQTWKAFMAGKYPDATPDQIADIGRGRRVRIGTYGDGGAVPQNVWTTLIQHADGHTAYTHQTTTLEKTNTKWAQIFMVSADTLHDARDAWANGRRTFRVVSDVSEKTPNEIICPASAEAGKRTTCEKCGLCAGASIAAKNIAIVAHGTGKANFSARVQ
jgi:hypothetical protein